MASSSSTRREADPMPPFTPKLTMPVPAPTTPRAGGSVGGGGDRPAAVVDGDGPDSGLVQPRVVALADHRDEQVVGPGLGDQVEDGIDHGVVAAAHGAGARQQDRCLHLAPLGGLQRPGQLAGAVEHRRAAGHRPPPEVGRVRGQHRGHAGPGAVALPPGDVADPHPGHVHDRVGRAGRPRPDLDAEVPGPGTWRRGLAHG